MLDTNTSDRPSLEESYLLATSTSDLTLNPDRVCAATHLIAAGLLSNRMGQALNHLKGEWDNADKPRKKTDAEIAKRAGELLNARGKPNFHRARTEALIGYTVALRHRAHSLAGWLPTLSIMAEWATRFGVDVDLLSPALYHWLAPACPVCDGLGRRPLENAPKLGMLGKTCHHCEGKREPGKTEGPTIWPRPRDSERIHDWLRSCIGKDKGDRGGVIHGRIDSDDLKKRAARRQKPVAEDERGAAAVAEVARNSMAGRMR